jgi:hypothetical protein
VATYWIQAALSFSLLTSPYTKHGFFTSLAIRANGTLPFVQSPYVEAPQFGGSYLSFNFPMPTAPPGAQRDPVTWFAPRTATWFCVGHLFCTIFACIVDDHMVFICVSIVEQRSSWFLSFCLLRLCIVINRLKSYTDVSSPVLCTGVLCCLWCWGSDNRHCCIHKQYHNTFFLLCLWVHNSFSLWPIAQNSHGFSSIP